MSVEFLQIICANSVQAGSDLAVTVTGFHDPNSASGTIYFLVPESPAIPIDPAKNGLFYTPNEQGIVSVTFNILATAPAGTYKIHAVDISSGAQGVKSLTITSTPLPTTTERVLTFSNNVEIRTQAVATTRNVEYEVLFDNTEWKVTRVTWDIAATQTHYAGLGEAQLDIAPYIISKNPDGSANLGQKTLKWNLLNGFDSVQKWSGAADVTVTSSVPEKVLVRMNHTYRIPLPSLTEQLCAINETVKVVLKAIVANPTTIPQVGTPVETTTDPPPDKTWDVFASFFGGLGAGALIAVAAIALIMLRK